MTSRKVDISDIKKTVKDLCFKANLELREDVLKAIENCYSTEKEGTQSKNMLKVLIENAGIAKEKKIPICQDTGMVIVFLNIGKDVVLSGGNVKEAVNEGVKEAYKEGFFRSSVVEDPITRKNTGTNTPVAIHIDIVDGDKVEILVMPKGFGSENKSRLVAGPDACPPYILGIGIGGTMDICAHLAKKALFRSINETSSKPHIKELEEKIKEKANALDIGVMGLGGNSTVIGVNIEVGPTHIAGLPVAVNVGCHALRSASAII